MPHTDIRLRSSNVSTVNRVNFLRMGGNLSWGESLSWFKNAPAKLAGCKILVALSFAAAAPGGTPQGPLLGWCGLLDAGGRASRRRTGLLHRDVPRRIDVPSLHHILDRRRCRGR